MWADLDTVVADGAVGAPWGPVEAAGRTPLHPDLDPPDLHRLVEGSTEVVLLVLVLLSCTDNTQSSTCLTQAHVLLFHQPEKVYFSV